MKHNLTEVFIEIGSSKKRAWIIFPYRSDLNETFYLPNVT